VSASAHARAPVGLAPGAPSLRVEWLGEVAYANGLALQHEAIEAVRDGGEDRLLLLEHPPVITLGRNSSVAHLLESRESLEARGVEVVSVPRGGDVTYHGRGQLVGYLISNLRRRGPLDVHRYLRDLEAALIDAAGTFGIDGCAVVGRTGVFVKAETGLPDRKLASIGVGVRHWITHHGFALNVDIDLREFDAIVPCGLADIEMTSLAREGAATGSDFSSAVREAVAKAFETRFGTVASPR
jgi:lipoate-protein ligase B